MRRDSHIVLSRKMSFRLAWSIFWMATGTSQLKITVGDGQLTIDGAGLIQDGD